MPPKLLFDISDIDLNRTLFGPEEVRRYNAQRFEMEMLKRVVHYDDEAQLIAGVREVREDEFWVSGHFPARPVFPGVMMIESAGQLCSFFYLKRVGEGGVMGFAACDAVKFRGTVEPGDQLLLLAKCTDIRPRIAKFETQAIVNGKIVFEGKITGMPLEL
jgi:3-hydroxyacyl-[acyl-carrier-protein] dehydratase